ncbi:MAG: hypothetical protein IJE01_04950 [Clostridia bacterium]|nr:hypothetical protein [Clostridia bacterium]
MNNNSEHNSHMNKSVWNMPEAKNYTNWQQPEWNNNQIMQNNQMSQNDQVRQNNQMWQEGQMVQSNQWPSANDNHTGSVDVRSFQEMLMESIGRFLVCRFLIGTEELVSAAGMLKNVGRDYFILEDPCTGMYTTCDLYSVKFISVLPEDFSLNMSSYCRRRLYENAPIFQPGI